MESTDRCAEPPARALPLSDALQRVLAAVDTVTATGAAGLKEAKGRVLAEDVHTPIDIPPFANSAMDGYAVRCSDLESCNGVLKVAGTAFAGHPCCEALKPGECVRIFTGAAIPPGADAVIMQEEVLRRGDCIHVSRPLRAMENIRPAGDEMPAGELLLHAGRRLTPADLGLLASAGIARVTVRRKLRVAYFSTGDELSPVGEALPRGMIYDSNRYALGAILDHPLIDATDLGVVRDDPEELADVLRRAASGADAIVTTGGVSVGDADFVTRVLGEMGRVDFWKIAVKPGKPFAFGSIGDARFFGLPGNPVAVMVVFHQLVRPALIRMAGACEGPDLRIDAICNSRLKKSVGRMEFQRGHCLRDERGQLRVTVCGAQGSHRLSGMSQANCFIVLAAECGDVQPGDVVTIEPLTGSW